MSFLTKRKSLLLSLFCLIAFYIISIVSVVTFGKGPIVYILSVVYTVLLIGFGSTILFLDKNIKRERNIKEKLNEEKAKVGFVLNNMSQGIIVISEKGTISIINSKVAGLFNSNYHDLLDLHYSEIITDNVLCDLISQSLKGNKLKPYELTIGDSTYRLSFNNLGYSHKGVRQKDLQLAIVFTDISDITKAAKIKQKFIADASHELKSPLTSIIGYQQLISVGLVSEPNEIKEYGELTLKEAEKMNEIVKDMLVLSRLEGDMDIEIKEVDMLKTFQEVLNSNEMKVKNKNISLVLDLSPCTLNINPANAYSLMNNLFSNAIKYNKTDGEIKVVLNQDNFIVSDNGIGISEKDIEHVFDRFFRAYSVLSEEGSGLGLAIVKHIASLYGYSLEVTSKIHVGSTFTVGFNASK